MFYKTQVLWCWKMPRPPTVSHNTFDKVIQSFRTLYLSIYQPLYLSFYLSITLSIYHFIYLPFYLSIYHYLCLSIFDDIHCDKLKEWPWQNSNSYPIIIPYRLIQLFASIKQIIVLSGSPIVQLLMDDHTDDEEIVMSNPNNGLIVFNIY